MSDHDPAIFERPGGVTVTERVRWGDMDALGHVNHTKLFTYCESARIAYFEAIDLDSFKERPTDGPGLVAANLDFRRQLKYPATAEVTARCHEIGGRSFRIAYRIVDADDGEVVAEGGSVNVWVDYAAEKAMELPDDLVRAIAEVEENPALGRGRG